MSDDDADGNGGADGPDGPDGPEDDDSERDAPLSGLADRVRDRDRDRNESGSRDRAPDLFADLERSRGDADADDGVGDPGDGPGAAPDDLTEAVEGGEGDEGDDPFEAMDVETVDEEVVWESLEGDEAAAADQPEVGSGGDAERVDPEDPHVDAPEHVVEKSAYCQRCRFFTDPPDVRCTHEGTTIVEVVDSERFRVRACPMVERGGAGGHADRD